ncbi:MAG: hypothetical protein KJ955_01995 [Nanoarchaeota archaeon]|nr:hypothetical protein [Nanoarchaeota archaeon]
MEETVEETVDKTVDKDTVKDTIKGTVKVTVKSPENQKTTQKTTHKSSQTTVEKDLERDLQKGLENQKTTPFTALENSTPDSFRFRNNNRKRIAQALKQARSGKKKDIKNKGVERGEKANGCSAAMVYWQSPAGLCRT